MDQHSSLQLQPREECVLTQGQIQGPRRVPSAHAPVRCSSTCLTPKQPAVVQRTRGSGAPGNDVDSTAAGPWGAASSSWGKFPTFGVFLLRVEAPWTQHMNHVPGAGSTNVPRTAECARETDRVWVKVWSKSRSMCSRSDPGADQRTTDSWTDSILNTI